MASSKPKGSPVTIKWIRGGPPSGIGEVRVGRDPAFGFSLNEKKREFRIMLWGAYEDEWKVVPKPMKGRSGKRIDKIGHTSSS